MVILRFLIIILLIPCLCYAGTQQASGLLASNIVTQVRANISEPTAGFWTDEQIVQWINDGIRDIVKRTGCFQAIEAIDLVSGQVEYSITTANYTTILAVHYIDVNGNTNGLELSSPIMVGRAEDVEEPEYWYDWAGKIGVFPAVPTRTTETINVYLIPTPALIISSDAIPTPEPYDTALSIYVTAKAWAKDRQSAKYAQAMQVYEAEMTRLKADFVPMPEKPIR